MVIKYHLVVSLQYLFIVIKVIYTICTDRDHASLGYHRGCRSFCWRSDNHWHYIITMAIKWEGPLVRVDQAIKYDTTCR